jgi:hypothetical protein
MKQARKLSLALLTMIVLLVFGFSLPRERTQAVGFQQAEPDEVRWTLQSNGFKGVYNLGNQKFSVESYHPSPDFSLTRILKPKGNTLLEIMRNSDTVTVTLGDTKVSFNLGTQSSFTDEEQLALQTALDSVDAMVARRISAAAISQLKRQGVERKLLVGLGAASILLGSDTDAGKKAELSIVTTVVPEACAADNCLGCCGSGCTGCIGCCTDACRRHDECVRQFGQFRCLSLLPAAIASIFLECFV